MGKDEERFIDIRSSGKGVVGRVHELSDEGKKITRIKASTRTHLLRVLRSMYAVDPSHNFNRRGVTYF